ncbi:hypothetical protein [Streptomyces fagopyri]|uniref:hypothetical protein n=1 Tax=Streptomyces fagopyri TaxID=2662397 RepID=UPI0033F700CD
MTGARSDGRAGDSAAGVGDDGFAELRTRDFGYLDEGGHIPRPHRRGAPARAYLRSPFTELWLSSDMTSLLPRRNG